MFYFTTRIKLTIRLFFSDMYKHLYTRIFYITVLIIFLFLDWKTDLPLYSYLILYVFYLLTAFWGTYFIQLNYFLISKCKGSRSKKEIAITFDDGPMKEFTPAILNILKKESTPAAFFLIGKNISGNEELVKQMNKDGHLVGNHSFEHGFWFSLSGKKNMTADLKKCDDEIERAIGKRPKFFRPPYGVTNPWIAKVIQRGSYESIGWSVRTYDTVSKSKKALLQKSLKKIENGDVILFHDWGKHTVGILSDFIREVRARDFKIVRLDELLETNAYY